MPDMLYSPPPPKCGGAGKPGNSGESQSNPHTRPSFLRSSERRRDITQLWKVVAVNAALCGNVTSRTLGVLHLNRAVELFRDDVSGKIPKIRRGPVDCDVGVVRHARARVSLRGPAWILTIRPRAEWAIRHHAQVVQPAHG